MDITLSANDIVPESYQMRLMMWRDEFTRGYFEIGDIANEIVLLNIETSMQVDQSAIYSAVGKFCGKSGRTVRDYAEVSAFYPYNMREEYDVLPFSHFRFAKSCGLRYQEILDYSMDNPSVSVEALEMIFGCHTPVAADMSVAAQPSVAASESVAAQPSVAAAPPEQNLREIYALSNLIAQTERLLMWDIHKDLRSELLTSLEGLKHVLACLCANDHTANNVNTPIKYPIYMDCYNK